MRVIAGLAEKPKIDIVWSWVNSTDPVWRRANALMEAKREGKDLTHEDLVQVDDDSEGFRFEYAHHHAVVPHTDSSWQ